MKKSNHGGMGNHDSGAAISLQGKDTAKNSYSEDECFLSVFSAPCFHTSAIHWSSFKKAALKTFNNEHSKRNRNITLSTRYKYINQYLVWDFVLTLHI